MSRLGFILLLVGLPALTNGCPDWQTGDAGGDSENAAESPIVAVPEVYSEPSTGGSSTGSAPTLPTGFPRDVPIYGPGTIAVSAIEGDGYHVEMLTSDKQWRVVSYYHQRLREVGWLMGKESRILAEDGEVFATKESRLFTLICHESPEQTQIMLTVADMSEDGGG